MAYYGSRPAAPMLDPQTGVRRATRSQAIAAQTAHAPQIMASPKISTHRTEDFFRNRGDALSPAARAQHRPPALDLDLAYVRPKLIPRLWKPGVAGWASLQAPGSPFSASAGLYMERMPHIRPRTLQRNTPRALGTNARIGASSTGRIAPALVPRARVSR